MDTMAQFLASAAGGSIGAAVITGVAALRHGDIPLLGVSLRDFPGVTGVSRPLAHPSINAALREAAGGWRVLRVVLVSGLVMASVNAAWDAAVPALAVRSAETVALRAAFCIPLSFWLVGRLLVGSIHRRLESHEGSTGVAA